MNVIDNWQTVAKQAKQQKMPVVVMVDQDHCPFCRRVESEFLAAIFAGGEFDQKAIFGKISIDEDETIVDSDGTEVGTREFLGVLNTEFTPTMLFLDAGKNELVEKMVGMGTPDYYGFYLERSIRKAIKQLQTSATTS